MTQHPPLDRADPGSTDFVLFGTVSAPTPVMAVVRRLRTTIALGLLRDGDRLPREADLVRRLGVTAFATREALSILREEGLITTRAGKHGGSFVAHGTDRAVLTSGELRGMSATELHELGDWRQMLASVSATLAAQRASTANVARLRAHAEALGSAETELDARRAHGRFQVELAAAAQSKRMTRAELAMYEEFDWLLGLALADPQRRSDSAQELATIADAVAEQQPEVARAAAERHSASMVEALVTLRLASIAGDATSSDVDAARLDSEVSRVLAAITRVLDALAGKVAVALGASTDEQALRTALSRAAMLGLADGEVEFDGLGFMAEPWAVAGSQYWVGWWQLTADGLVADDRHVVDPDRDDFYDYVAHEYFTLPRDSGRMAAEGPYVDYGGTNDYIVTFAMPVISEGRFLGVAAVDLAVAAIERQLAPWLAASDHACILVNAERRIIVTNAADRRVGQVLASMADLHAEPTGAVGWSLLRNKPKSPAKGRTRSR